MIDLRSDTKTQPSAEMRQAMAEAPVGDATRGEDLTVKKLENMVSEKLGKPSSVFTTTATSANLMALLAHCDRGDGYIAAQETHIHAYEKGGTVFGGILPYIVEPDEDYLIDFKSIAQTIEQPSYGDFCDIKLLCLENTFQGRALPLSYLKDARDFCDQHGLVLHMDGARLFNAATALDVEPKEIVAFCDTVTLCFSKGLGTPTGAVLAGHTNIIEKTKDWQSMLGNSMRKPGMLAGAAIYALEHNVKRLHEDHETARLLKEGLADIEPLKQRIQATGTNMVFLDLDIEERKPLSRFLHDHDILVNAAPKIRLVTHMDITWDHIEKVIEAFRAFYG